MKKSALKIITFSFALALLVLPSYFAFAIEYGGLGGRPAFPDESNPRSSSIFVHTMKPGTNLADGVRVINNTKETKTMLVYAADSARSTGGAFACKQMNEAKTDVGAWIKLSKTEVVLESGKSEVVPFDITVPANASVGEHNGCILIQEKKDQLEGLTGAILSIRNGIRVAITIPGEIFRKLEMVGFDIERKDTGIIVLKPKVKNLGNVSIDADVKVKTNYFFGAELSQKGGGYPILRGETSDWNFELEKPFWGGFYKSQLVLTYDENENASIGVKSGKPLTVLNSASVWFWSTPKVQALIIEIVVLIIIISLLYVLYLSRKRKKWIKAAWVDYTTSKDDNINSLAQKFDISWKLLASANNLKPPYTLVDGTKIKVPPKS